MCARDLFPFLLLRTLSKSPTSKLSTPMPPPCLSVPHRTLDPPNGPKTSIVHTAPSRDVKWNPDPRFSRPPGREAKRPPMHCMRGSKKRAARRLLVTGRPTRSWVLTRDRPCWRSLFGTSHLHFRYRRPNRKRLSASPRAVVLLGWTGDQLVLMMAVARWLPKKHCARLLSHEGERGHTSFVLVVPRVGIVDDR